MNKIAIKPLWLGVLGLVLMVGVAIKLALAITAFVPADQPIGYISQDEVSNYDLRSGNEVVFRTQYERESWSEGTTVRFSGSMSGW